MAKSLQEAAADMLRQAAVSNQEPFGVGKNPQAYAPQPQAGEQDMGGDTPYDDRKSGVQKAGSALVGVATPPGKVGLGNGEMSRIVTPGSTPPQAMAEEDDLDEEDQERDPDDKELEEEGENEVDTTHQNVEQVGADGDQEIPEADTMPTVPDRVKSYFNSKNAIGTYQIQEDIDAMFAGQDLSESFKKKAAKIYEAAIIAATTEVATQISEELETAYVEQLELVTESIKESLTDKVDDYLNYMVEEWVKENQVAIEHGIRAELAEDFISGLKNLFTEHYIEIPEDKVNVVETLASEVDSLRSRIDEEVAKNVEFKKKINEYRKHDVLKSVCEGLTTTQYQKMVSLSEAIDFTTEKEYTENLKTLRENYYPKTGTPKAEIRQLDEEAHEGNDKAGVVEDPTDEMSIYASVLSRTLKI